MTHRWQFSIEAGWEPVRHRFKGGNSQAEMKRANDLQQQFMNMYKQQIGMADPTLQAIIANQGMLPQTQAAMTSLTMNQLPATYNQLYGALNNRLTQAGVTGGGMAGGGDIARQMGWLGSQEAGQQAQSLADIQLAKQQNLNNALSMTLGIAPSMSGATTSALSSGVNAAQAADAAQTGFFGSLFGGLSGMASSGFFGMPK